MKHNFEEKKQQRIDSYENRADKARDDAQTAFKRSDDLVRHIPPGQPILVGHHSEKRHRNTLDKSHNAMRKGIELENKAEYYDQRAEAARRNTAIFSDDPNASEKLADKIERLEAMQDLMKKANACVRKNDVEGLKDLGFSDASITKLLTGDYIGRLGFPSYELTNNGANIRRLKKRLEQMKKLDEMETSEQVFGDIRIVQNAEANRTQIIFPGKPSAEIRKKMKDRGFRYSPTENAWQRHLSDGAKYWAEQIVKGIIN